MLVDMAWALYSNRTQQVHGTSFRLDHDSSLKPKPIMWLLNLKSYVVIEFEILAACWAISKCKLFFSGLPHFTVITDHNPLIPIINNHRLDEIENPYLQRFKTKLMAYNFTAQWQQCNNATMPLMLFQGILFGILSQPTTLLKEMFIITLRCPLLNLELLERCIMKILKASIYKSYENMLNKTRSTSHYAHLYWMDSLAA